MIPNMMTRNKNKVNNKLQAHTLDVKNNISMFDYKDKDANS